MLIIIVGLSVLFILIITMFLRELNYATPVCGSCVHYRRCYKGHPEYNKRNTQEHPSCGEYKA